MDTLIAFHTIGQEKSAVPLGTALLVELKYQYVHCDITKQHLVYYV